MPRKSREGQNQVGAPGGAPGAPRRKSGDAPFPPGRGVTYKGGSSRKSSVLHIPRKRKG
jgi:hypothetical protein